MLAALLHYFLLALFCWMLCEGVLLYFLLVKVFGGGAEDKVKYFYLFGWGKLLQRQKTKLGQQNSFVICFKDGFHSTLRSLSTLLFVNLTR